MHELTIADEEYLEGLHEPPDSPEPHPLDRWPDATLRQLHEWRKQIDKRLSHCPGSAIAGMLWAIASEHYQRQDVDLEFDHDGDTGWCVDISGPRHRTQILVSRTRVVVASLRLNAKPGRALRSFLDAPSPVEPDFAERLAKMITEASKWTKMPPFPDGWMG